MRIRPPSLLISTSPSLSSLHPTPIHLNMLDRLSGEKKALKRSSGCSASSASGGSTVRPSALFHAPGLALSCRLRRGLVGVWWVLRVGCVWLWLALGRRRSRVCVVVCVRPPSGRPLPPYPPHPSCHPHPDLDRELKVGRGHVEQRLHRLGRAAADLLPHRVAQALDDGVALRVDRRRDVGQQRAAVQLAAPLGAHALDEQVGRRAALDDRHVHPLAHGLSDGDWVK